MQYWVLEAIPQNSMSETEIVWDEHGADAAGAVRAAKRLARSILRPKGMLVHWAVYGPFTLDRSTLFEDGVI